MASSTVSNGQAVRLRLTAGVARPGADGDADGGRHVCGLHCHRARARRRARRLHGPGPLFGQPAATLVQGAWVRPTGFLDPAPVTVLGGEVLLEVDTVWRTSGTLEPGQRFRVRLTSGAVGRTVSATVSVWDIQATFSVTSGS